MDQQQNLQDHGEVYGQEEKGEEDVAGKIFIGGLSWQTNEQTLREHFERYGELTDVALMFDKRSNKPRYFHSLLILARHSQITFVQRFWLC